MELHITARHFDLTPRVREHCEERVARLARYFDQIHSGTITITKDRSRYLAELSLQVGGGGDLASSQEAVDMFPAIDGAIDRLESQIRTHKGRLSQKRGKGEKVGAVLAEEAERAAEAGEDGEEEWTEGAG